MLQCQRCQQWFHQECIRNPNVPQLLWGDRFWDFVCTLCTGTTVETVEKLPMGWVDALHLILFNLIVTNRKEHHDLETAIIPLFKKNLKLLQSAPSSVLKSSRIDPHHFETLLKSNKSKFKCGSKRSKFWTLTKVVPPLAPHNKSQKTLSVIDVNFKNKKTSSTKNTVLPRRPALKTAVGHTRKRKLKTKDLDSLGESSDASSFGSLDSFIPRPKDFEGDNNPFRTCAEGFIEPFLMHSVIPKRSKRERKFRSSPPCSSLGSAGSSPHSSISSGSSENHRPPSVPEVQGVSNWTKTDLKWSLNSYFGANHRIARGEHFNVIAKRLNSHGDVQHLMAWEQPITKPFLANLVENNIEDLDPNDQS